VTAVLLALLTAVSYGIANYLGPLLSRTHPLGGVLLIGQGIGAVGAIGLLAYEGGAPPDARHLLYGVLAGACNGVALAALYTAAGAGPISIVSPIGATGAVVPVVVGIAGGERPELLQLLGIPVAMVGVVLAAARHADAVQHATRRTIAFAVLSAVAFGGFLSFFGRASADGVPWAVMSSRVALLACTAAVLLARPVPVRVPARAVPAIALPGVLLLVGTVAYATATTKGLLSVVSVIATLSPLVTVGLAVAVLGERLAPRQRVGVGAALLGVVLLAVG
jgi:drug/metabolite transporter (DMT)-like permease